MSDHTRASSYPDVFQEPSVKLPGSGTLADPSVAKIVLGIVHHKIKSFDLTFPFDGSIVTLKVRADGQVINPEVLETLPTDLIRVGASGFSMTVHGAHGPSFKYRGYVPDLLLQTASWDHSYGENLYLPRKHAYEKTHLVNWAVPRGMSYEHFVRVIKTFHDI